MRTYRHRETKCPSCGEILDAASGFDEDKLTPGDVMLCFYCSHIMICGDDRTPREPTAAEAHEIAGDPVLLETIEAMHAYRQR